jgi:hypothetical protein
VSSLPFRTSIVFVFAALLASLSSTGTAAQGASSAGAADDVAGALNLPAMVLTPGDLEALGLPGFGKYGLGYFARLEGLAGGMADYLGKPAEDVLAFYESVGWRRMYGSNMGVPSDPNAPGSPPSRSAITLIAEYADADGADAALSFGEDATDTTIWEIVVDDNALVIGDRARVVRSHLAAENGGPVHEFYVVFHLGNLVALAGFQSFEDALDGATPGAGDASSVPPAGTLAELEALGNRLQEKMATTLATGEPGLPAEILRLDRSADQIAFFGEGYRRYDGEVRRFYNEAESDLNAYPAVSTDPLAVHEAEQGVQSEPESSAADSFVSIRLYRYADDGAASDFLQWIPERMAADPAVTSAEPIEGDATVGDEVMRFAFVVENEGGDGKATNTTSGSAQPSR